MKLIHLSDIHIWRYTWDPRRLWGVRALGMMELLMGRAGRFRLERLEGVVERVSGLNADHILITGDLTTTALPSEFLEAKRLLGPLLADPQRVTMLPGNHDRTTRRAMQSRRFEEAFAAFLPRPRFPWLRPLDDETAILGLDPTQSHFSARGYMPPEELHKARELIADPSRRPRRLIVACHYPVAAPTLYERELQAKRIENVGAVREWLAGIGPHVYCCGHVHAAWAFQPPGLPNQICLNAGAPLMRDSSGLRLPGFLEIQIRDLKVTAIHHAWNGADWIAVPLLQDIEAFAGVPIPTPA